MRNSSGKLPFDICKDQATRHELYNLHDACEEGDIDAIRLQLQAGSAVKDSKPWMKFKLSDKTQHQKRSPLHSVVLGAVFSIKNTLLSLSKEKKKSDPKARK